MLGFYTHGEIDEQNKNVAIIYTASTDERDRAIVTKRYISVHFDTFRDLLECISSCRRMHKSPEVIRVTWCASHTRPKPSLSERATEQQRESLAVPSLTTASVLHPSLFPHTTISHCFIYFNSFTNQLPSHNHIYPVLRLSRCNRFFAFAYFSAFTVKFSEQEQKQTLPSKMSSFQDRAQHQISQLDKEVSRSYSVILGLRKGAVKLLSSHLPIQHCLPSYLTSNLLMWPFFLAVKIPPPQQPRKTDFCPQGVRCPRSGGNLLLPRLLQHCWRVPG